MAKASIFKTQSEAFDYIAQQGLVDDIDIDLIESAIAMALIFLPGINIDRYRQHIKKIFEQVNFEFNSSIDDGKTDSLKLRIHILRQIVCDKNEYCGDNEYYDDIENANIIRVIERRRGLPVALGVIYIYLAKKMGWDCDGISFPGHFLLKMDYEGDRIILDPFRNLEEMEASDLRNLLKSIIGENAELSHDFYNAVSKREVLLRLENNLKKRFIDMEDYSNAVKVAEIIEAFCPDEYRIYFDEAVLYAKLGNIEKAVKAINIYIEKTPNKLEKEEAKLLLEEINQKL